MQKVGGIGRFGLAVNFTLSVITADIVKMLDNMPEIAPHIRRVRGGYLKIQGTWMKYDVGSSCVVLFQWKKQI